MARTVKKKKELTLEEKLAEALVPAEEQPYQVPENWQYYRINGLSVHLKRGKAPKYVDHSDIPVFAQKCNQKDGTIEYENDVVDPSECPTDLPNSWSWIRMGAVGYTNIGLTYRPSDKSDDGIIVLRSSNIQNGKMYYEDIVRVTDRQQ